MVHKPLPEHGLVENAAALDQQAVQPSPAQLLNKRRQIYTAVGPGSASTSTPMASRARFFSGSAAPQATMVAYSPRCGRCGYPAESAGGCRR